MKLGAQRLVDVLLAAIPSDEGDRRVLIDREDARDLLTLMRSAAKQDRRQPDGFAPPSRFEGYMVIAWLRNESYEYRSIANGQPKGQEKAVTVAYAETCRLIADDLEKALELGKGEPIDPGMPRRFRYKGRRTTEPVPERVGGVYFPRTDLVVTDMGDRGTGKPQDVDWIDPEPT